MSKVKSKSKKDPHAPFDPMIWQEARQIAETYDLVLRFEDGEWYGHALEFPGVMSDGATPTACVQSVREALTLAVATMIEDGEVPPSPAREELRSEQVNVRLTLSEKNVLESRARSKGFKGLSDFVRTSVLVGQ